MNATEFTQETNRLENMFEKELNSYQRQEWFQNFKNMPVENYRIVITNAIKQCRYMPKLADILEIKKSSLNVKKEEERTECSKCNGTGYIIYEKKIGKLDNTKNVYAVRCDCQNGRKKPKEILGINEVGVEI